MYQIMGEGYRGTVSVYGNTSERIHVMVICINNHDDTMSISQDCSWQDLSNDSVTIFYHVIIMYCIEVISLIIMVLVM